MIAISYFWRTFKDVELPEETLAAKLAEGCSCCDSKQSPRIGRGVVSGPHEDTQTQSSEVTTHFSRPTISSVKSISMGRRATRQFRLGLLAVILVLSAATSLLTIRVLPRAWADVPFSLNAVPSTTQEGNTVSLVLSVTGAMSGTLFSFRFSVTDPVAGLAQTIKNYTTLPGQDTFQLVVAYPSPSLQGSNTLLGQYQARVDEILPTAAPGVATTSFFLSVTDSASYMRTQTIAIQAAGYNASEPASVTIQTQTTSTQVFSAPVTASSTGLVTSSWKIPRNATLDNYIVTVTGTSTTKKPADLQQVSVIRATMTVTTINSLKSSYQRTEVLRFYFQPTYPDGTIPSTGVALLTLTRPDASTVTLTATYDFIFQTFDASYQTGLNDLAGAWTISLASHGYSDAYGNIGPGVVVTNSPQLTPLPLAVNVVVTNTTVSVGQNLRLTVNVTYPDGSVLQSGNVKAYLLYSGTPAVNDSIPMVFDSNLKLWLGTYTVHSSDTGGLWSLIVKVSDSAPSPPNSGSGTRAITVLNSTGGTATFPLFYFGIITALLAFLLAAVFFLFRRRKVAHARLKIDLDAVRSEAGRIESSDFFQSVKDQVHKEKENK